MKYGRKYLVQQKIYLIGKKLTGKNNQKPLVTLYCHVVAIDLKSGANS